MLGVMHTQSRKNDALDILVLKCLETYSKSLQAYVFLYSVRTDF